MVEKRGVLILSFTIQIPTEPAEPRLSRMRRRFKRRVSGKAFDVSRWPTLYHSLRRERYQIEIPDSFRLSNGAFLNRR